MTIHKTKHCTKCGLTKSGEDFYRRRKGSDLSSYCKICTKNQTLQRQRVFKEKCVEYKGGKCEVCGYKNCMSALEFHHKDPSKKDFTLAKVRLTAFSDKVMIELDKCVLLCANCHREAHNGMHNFS